MKAKVTAYYGYSYLDKSTGELKVGRYIDVVFDRVFLDDDKQGNFSYGSNTRTIRLTDTILNAYDHEWFVNSVGKIVSLDFETPPGKKFEVLVEIDLV